MDVVCLDFESVLIPEIWPALANQTGIEELKRTTKEEPDYHKLMHMRLRVMSEHNLTINNLQQVIAKLKPLPGAKIFLDWARAHYQVVIISDTFYELAAPFIKKLEYPTIFCHQLEVASNGAITNYKVRQPDPKRKVVKALHSLKYRCLATGDSYNDIPMLEEADFGVLFKPPQNVVDDYPQFPVVQNYQELKRQFSQATTKR